MVTAHLHPEYKGDMTVSGQISRYPDLPTGCFHPTTAILTIPCYYKPVQWAYTGMVVISGVRIGGQVRPSKEEVGVLDHYRGPSVPASWYSACTGTRRHETMGTWEI